MTFHSGKRLRAFKSKAISQCSRTPTELEHPVTPPRTLIDVLEPRLLYSADHPLGLSLSAGEANEAERLLEEAEIASDASDMLGVFRREALMALDDLEDLALTPSVDTNEILVDDPSQVIVFIEVSTTEDVVDAPDLSSIEALSQHQGADGKVSLREAIAVANADIRVNEIRLSAATLPDEVYSLTLQDDVIVNGAIIRAGDLDVSGSYVIRGEGRDSTVIEQGTGGGRVFDIHTGTVTITDLTIRNGLVGPGESGGGVFIHSQTNAAFERVNFFNNDAGADGGAIYLAGDTDQNDVDLSLTEVLIMQSDADRGAGVRALENTTTVVHNSTFLFNDADDDGGAILSQGELNISNSVFERNTVESTETNDNTRGGAVFLDYSGEALIENTVFRANSATSDGGAIASHGELTLIDSALIDNTAGRNGGGFFTSGDGTLLRVTAWGNKVENDEFSVVSEGGAVFGNPNSTVDISYSVIANNRSENYSAGVGLEGNAEIRDSIIVDNLLPSLGFGAAGIAYAPEDDGNRAIISNTVVANNLHGSSPSDIHSYSSNKVISEGFNLVESLYGSGLESAPSDFIEVDPGDFSVELVDNRWAQITVGTVDAQTGNAITNITVNNGSSEGVGKLTISGIRVGDTPNIGGYENKQTNGMVFWSDDAGGYDSAIYRSDASFAASQEIISNIRTPLDIEVDARNQRLYWLDDDDYSIKSALFDGSDIRTERLVNEKSIAFALDVENDRIFIATSNPTPQIIEYGLIDSFNVDEDRSGLQIRSLAGVPADIELDQDSQILYWSEEESPDTARIWSLDTSTEDLAATTAQQIAVTPNVRNPYALTVNDSVDEIYWSEPKRHQVVLHEESIDTTTNGNVEVQIDPSALVYDSVNDRLLVASDDKTTFWIDSEFQFYSGLNQTPEVVTRMAYARVDGPDVSPVFSPDPVFNVTEGLAAALDNYVLGVVDEDTPDEDILFIVIEEMEGQVYVSGVPQSSFTLTELKTANVVEFRHSGTEPSVAAYLKMVVADRQSVVELPTIQFIVDGVNDNAPVAIDHMVTAKHGAALDTVSGAESSLLFGMTDEDENSGFTDNYEVVVSNVSTNANVNYSSVDGTFEYVPPELSVDVDFTDTFNYQIVDSEGNQSNIATVEVRITALEAPTITKVGEYTAATEQTAFTMSLTESFAFSSSEDATLDTWVLTYADGSLPQNNQFDWLTFDPNTAELSGTPSDSDTGILSLAVIVIDSNGLASVPLIFDIQVENINQQPIVTSSNVMSVDENMPISVIGTVFAEDADGDVLTYSIAGGDDAGLFLINEISGELAFKTSKNHESYEDANSDGLYEVKIRVDDGTDYSNSIVSSDISVSVNDVNDAPVILSDGIVSITEKNQFVVNLNSMDEDGDPRIYSIDGGADQNLFRINESNGVLSFKTDPVFDSPLDADGNSVYEVTVKNTDIHGAVATLDLSVTVISERAPILVSAITDSDTTELAEYSLLLPDSFVFDSPDNATPYVWDVTYSASGMPDAPLPDTLWLAFDRDNATLTGTPGDQDTGVLSLKVTVTDTNGLTSAPVPFNIQIQNINQSPVIHTDEFVMLENSANGVVGQVVATDPDADDVLDFSLIGGADESLFSIEPETGKVSFNTTPNFEMPDDFDQNRRYDITVQVDDSANGGLVTKDIHVILKDANDVPVVEPNVSIDFVENQTDVLVVTAIDEDEDRLQFSIIEQSDNGMFTIDAESGQLSFAEAPDFEAVGNAGGQREYTVRVEVDDGQSGVVYQDIIVKVSDANDAPDVEQQVRISVAENQTDVLTVSASDQDGDTLTYSIIEQSDSGVFTIEASSGQLSFVEAPDFEAVENAGGQKQYSVKVRVDDGNEGGVVHQEILVNVSNANDAPDVEPQVRISVAENQTDVLTVRASDEDGDILTYSIVEQSDSELFTVESVTGQISFLVAPDFEAVENAGGQKEYTVKVQVDDGNVDGVSHQDVLVKVSNVNEAPDIERVKHIKSAENITDITTVVATDEDGDELRYSLLVGNDADLFSINPVSGQLSFVDAPDFESSEGNGELKEFKVTVQVDDGNEGFGLQDIHIQVTNANDAPVIGQDTRVVMAENQVDVLLVSASDEDGDDLIFSIAPGGDAELFKIDSAGGMLSFKIAPDFENPANEAGENVYRVTVQADDDKNGTSTQSIIVEVQNDNDKPTINKPFIDQVLNEDTVIDVGDGYFSDQDGDELKYSMTRKDGLPLPEWIDFNVDTAELRLGVIPSESKSEQVSLLADDQNGGILQITLGVSYVTEVDAYEPILQAAVPDVPSFEVVAFSEIDTVGDRFTLPEKNKPVTAVSENSFSSSLEGSKSLDATGPDASASVSGVAALLLHNGFVEIESWADTDRLQREVLRSNVISEFLAAQGEARFIETDTSIKINIFDDSVNISNLFSAARQQDADMFATLSEDFKKQQAELESQASIARGITGSAITMTSGLSVGYFLYLLRGGAIMSSMLTSLPAWRFVDPLPILGTLDESLDADDESLQSIVGDSVKSR